MHQEALDAMEALEQSVIGMSHGVTTNVERLVKIAEASLGARLDADEVEAWDRFVAAAIVHAPARFEMPEEVIAYAEDVADVAMDRRRVLFDDDAKKTKNDDPPAAPKGSKYRHFIEGAQQLEAKFIASKFTRHDLFERAKLLRDRADRLSGLEPPNPSTVVPPAAADAPEIAASSPPTKNGAPNPPAQAALDEKSTS